MPFADLPIKQKLMFITVAATGIILLITSITFVTYEWSTFRRSLVENMETLSRVIAENSTAALAFQNKSDASAILTALKAEDNVQAAALYDSDGKLFAFYPETARKESFPVKVEDAGPQFKDGHLVIFQPVVQGETRYGTLYLQAGLEIIYHRIRRYAEIVLVILLFSMFASVIIVAFLHPSISRPVRALADAARIVSEKKDYSVRVDIIGKDELGMMTQTFNEMLEEIQKSDSGLRKALSEKELLIQEVHHRVKNNMQVIVSLFSMQARHLKSPETVDILEDCKARIRSMSLVHEMLYGGSDLSRVNFAEYLQRMTEDLVKSHSRGISAPQTTIELGEFKMDIRKAVPLGMMLNEILTNALKHGLKDRPDGRIFMRLNSENGQQTLIVGDNGPGIPETVELANPKTFGLKLIRLLSEQADVQLDLDRANGTVYTIRFNPT